MNDKINNNKENKNNQIFQRIKKSIFQEKEKKIVVVQKKKKKKGNYILGDTIGEGAFAKVKVAKHIYTGEKVAIKILNKEHLFEDESEFNDINKIRKEINILKRIRHKNIIQLYEIMESNSHLYIVMKKKMKKKKKKKKIKIKKIKKIKVNICQKILLLI